MNKEPVALYIFRFALGFGLFAFMCMLYWSSALIENNIKQIRFELAEIRNDIFALRLEASKNNATLQQLSTTPPQQQTQNKDISLVVSAPNELYPNLLQPDPFYLKTLPDMLGPSFKPHGTLRGATLGRPDNLHPFNNFFEIGSWNALCTGSVGKGAFGKYETLTPDMALRMEARPRANSDVPEFWIHLRRDLYWQPLNSKLFENDMPLAPQFLRKHPVTAHDFAFYYDAVMNPHVEQAGAIAIRSEYQQVEEIEVIDDYTFVVRWKSSIIDGIEKIPYRARFFTSSLTPLPQFVYKYFADGKKIVDDDAKDTYRTSKIWAQNFGEHWAKNIIVSCGAWIFDGMNEQGIKFKRNPDHYDALAALTEHIDVRFKEGTEGIWQDFQAGSLDSYNLSPDQLLEWENFEKSNTFAIQKIDNNSIDQLNYVSRAYFYIGWNQATPFFKNINVRQALTMAIDRQRIVEQILNGLGKEISCPFYLSSPSCDPNIKPWPFDPIKAKRLLAEEGWIDSDGDGIIDKEINGKRVPFAFTMTYYVKNHLTKSLCEYIATALKKIGISCSLNGVDMADLSLSFQEKNFDALCMGWALGAPPEDPKQLWSSSGAHEKGSSNAVGFANAEADEIITALQYEEDPQKRIALYHRFHRIIHEEQPYTFLYSPITKFLYRQRLQNVFLPINRQDLVPGANIALPDSSIYWLKTTH